MVLASLRNSDLELVRTSGVFLQRMVIFISIWQIESLVLRWFFVPGGRSHHKLALRCVLRGRIFFVTNRVLFNRLWHSALEKIDAGSATWSPLLNNIWIVV
jgi:hypothetical protein